MKTDKIELINQGSYGCIYHPGLTCKGTLGNTRFITKIQKRRDNSDKETQIGKKIKKIKHYQNYFAPVLNSCPINISTIDNKELKKCEFVANKPKDTYMSNRIKYIGTETLADYLLRIFQNNPNQFLSILVDSYLYLLTSLTLLNDIKIVHMDLKENNIVVDSITEKPIIIDFGMSFDTTEIQSCTMTDNKNNTMKECENIKNIFFVYGSDYAPWCIEISMITYINEIQNLDEIVTQKQLEFIINDYLKTNPVLQYITPIEASEYHKALMTYVTPMIGKNWKDLVTKLTESIDTWDNYAIAIIILQIIHNMDIAELKPIIDILKTVILSVPDKRINANETKIKVTQSVIKMTKTKGLLDKIHKKSKDKDFIEKQINNNKNSKLAILRREEYMNQKLFK